MSLPNSRFPKDEMDCLIREALEARVGGQEPPERVWKRIQRDLEPAVPRRRRFQTSWHPLVFQAVLSLLLMLIGGAGLRTLLNTVSFVDDASPELRPSVTIAYVEERTSPTNSLPISEEADVRLLRSLSRPSPEHQPVGEAANAPPIVVPPDPPPRAMARSVRARQVDLSQFGPPPEEQNRLQGGPYEWFR
jgi:hypothetical protein